MLRTFWDYYATMELFPALPSIDTHVIFILFLAATVAGWVDSIAGGGGLIGLPVLLWAGLSPVQALATGKLQASFGTLTAVWNYSRKGLANPRKHLLAILLTFIGSASGVLTVQQVDSALLAKLIPVLTICFALYFMFSPKVSDIEGKQLISQSVFAVTAGFGIGFYDGFFGPGAGTFFTMAFVTLLGYSLPHAIGNTKLLNLTSNVTALVMFIFSGQVVWLLGLIMAVGQIIGSYLGSHMAIQHGSRLIKPVLVVMSLLVSIRLLLAE